ncbi:MAG: DUF1232 domain-containing protein [Endomicrobiales bacterium]|nr:DUF1232 domain-containing protein [Endomicrobiales bacterium]
MYKNIFRKIMQVVYYHWLLFTHPKTPFFAKTLFLAAIFYVFTPFDIVVDMIPWLGQADDIAVVLIFFNKAKQLIPESVVQECKITASTRYPDIISRQ